MCLCDTSEGRLIDCTCLFADHVKQPPRQAAACLWWELAETYLVRVCWTRPESLTVSPR